MQRLRVRAAGWASGLIGTALIPLGACSAPTAGADAGPAPTPCRMLLRTAADWPAAAPLAAEVARRTALPVPGVLPITARLFAITLQAPDAATCAAARARLTADPGFALGADPDRRRTRPAPPAASSAQ
ncbi:MAG: hypothetical protein KGI90_15850 [Burkholderiales bacterium]|nr:hypothetical protein [Burkholderiales bacterium]